MLKIYGERNSGTNYISRLLELNLQTGILQGVAPVACVTERSKDLFFEEHYLSTLGWKHSVAPDRALVEMPHLAQVQFVTISKNLYSWLVSFFRRPYHHPAASRNFSTFIRSEVPSVGRERLGHACANPIDVWNAKTRSYLELPEARHVHVRYETVLEDPRAFVEAVGNRFSITKSPRFFTNIVESTKNSGQTFADYRESYLGEQWKAAFCPADLDFVRQYADVDLMNRLGYALL